MKKKKRVCISLVQSLCVLFALPCCSFVYVCVCASSCANQSTKMAWGHLFEKRKKSCEGGKLTRSGRTRPKMRTELQIFCAILLFDQENLTTKGGSSAMVISLVAGRRASIKIQTRLGRKFTKKRLRQFGVWAGRRCGSASTKRKKSRRKRTRIWPPKRDKVRGMQWYLFVEIFPTALVLWREVTATSMPLVFILWRLRAVSQKDTRAAGTIRALPKEAKESR
jgi:hypothetical protein